MSSKVILEGIGLGACFLGLGGNFCACITFFTSSTPYVSIFCSLHVEKREKKEELVLDLIARY